MFLSFSISHQMGKKSGEIHSEMFHKQYLKGYSPLPGLTLI